MTTPPTSIISLDPATVHREVLPNGLTVLVRRDTSAPVVAIVTYVKAGYFDETDDVVGIAHVLEHMFFKGTERRGVGEIAKETKAQGGYLNASTIYDHTSYYTVLPSSGFEAGLAIQADAYANSVLDAGELARELEVIIQEAKRKSDNPSAVTVETLYELLHDRHRIRRWRIGREPGLRRLGRDDLLAFYRNFYRPSNTILTVAGDVEVAAALDAVRRQYGALSDAPVQRTPGPEETAGPGFRYRELHGDIAEPELAFGWRTVHALHPDAPALDTLATVLGAGRASRLYQGVRERQLAASVSAYHYTPTELGVFVIHAEARERTTREAAAAIWAELRALRERGIGEEEMERARRIFESRWLRRLETMEGQANFLAEWEALGDWTLGDRYFERMMAIGGDEVVAAAERYLAPEHAGLIAYRPDRVPQVFADADEAWRALEGGTARSLDAERAAAAEASAPQEERAPRAAAEGADEVVFVPVELRASPELERAEGPVRVYRLLPNDVPLLVWRRPGAPITHVGVFALGGAIAEPAELGGITNLMARASVKGTARRTGARIAEESELLGGSIAPSVSNDGFGWTISVPTARLGAALELLADVVQNPVFPDDAVETERAVALANVAALRDDMYRYPVRLAAEAAFAGHPYAASVLGREDSLRRITSADVRDWHARRVLAAPLVIAIVGDVAPIDGLVAVPLLFTGLRWEEEQPLAPPVWASETAVRVERREKAQTALALAFPGPDRRDDARFATSLIAGVASGLGGRFFDELRDRQSLCYTVQAFASERRLAGTFLTYIATSPEKEEVARRGLLAELARFRDEPVREEELARAKRYAIGTHAIHQQSAGAVLGDLVDAWLYGTGLHELDEYEARISAVTAREMQEAAQRYLAEERRVEGIVRGVGKEV